MCSPDVRKHNSGFKNVSTARTIHYNRRGKPITKCQTLFTLKNGYKLHSVGFLLTTQ